MSPNREKISIWSWRLENPENQYGLRLCSQQVIAIIATMNPEKIDLLCEVDTPPAWEEGVGQGPALSVKMIVVAVCSLLKPGTGRHYYGVNF